MIGDKSREDEKDSGFGRTDDSTKNDSEQDGGDDRLLRDEKEQHKAQMDALGKQIIHFTACASNARELGLRDSPREKSSDEHSQRSGEREKRDRSSKHSSRKSGSKTSSDDNHSSSHEHKNKNHKSHKSSRNSESSPVSSKSKERSEGKDRSEHKRKKERSKDNGDTSRSTRSSRDDRGSHHNGHQSSNENPELKVEWRVRRNKDGSRIFISKKLKPAKQRLLRERAQKLAEERRGMTTDDETQSVYLGRYWSREDRRRQMDKIRQARRSKRVEMEAERQGHGATMKRHDFQIIELTQKKMASTEQTFDDFMTVEEILRQRNRLGFSSGPVFVTTV